ncbi:MAG: ABC transporter substrate-binding protein, partial [Clostridia bacterium]
AVVKTVNYQYDIDQSQAEGIRPNGMDSNFSWHYYPINVLHCDYDAKEIQIAQVMDVIAGKMAYDDLSGDGKTWYNGYTTVMDMGFRSAYDTNLATANAWGWSVGAWEVARNQDKVNIFPAACYADTPSMERLWTAMETLENEYFLKVLTGEASLDTWDEFVAEWMSLGGDKITAEVQAYAAQ